MGAVGDAEPTQWSGRDGARAITLRIPAKPEYITLCRLALTGLSPRARRSATRRSPT